MLPKKTEIHGVHSFEHTVTMYENGFQNPHLKWRRAHLRMTPIFFVGGGGGAGQQAVFN